jgi:ParB-like chromosome segregation protein Spo0J
MTDATYETLAIDNIEATAATQVRVRLDRHTIEEYQEALENGAEMPPLLVFREANSERYILADGFHRLYAMVNLGWDKVVCEVRYGRMVDALREALGANQAHGLRRTNADKRNAVQLALKDPELSKLTQQEIADICGVTDRTVRNIHQQMLTEDEDRKAQKKDKKAKVKDPDDDDVVDTGEVPQEVVDLNEVRDALNLIRALPYDGADAAARLPLDKDDVANAEYVSTWLAGLVIAARKGGQGG